MKKLIILVLVLLFALSAFAGTVSATPIDDLTTSAAHLPSGTLFYHVIRTDAGFAETLGGLFNTALEKLPEGTVPPGTDFSDLLDMMVQDFTEKSDDTFADAIQPWLGDTITAAVTSDDAMQSNNRITWLIDVADHDAAAVFLEFELVEDTGGFPYYEVTELPDGALLYTSEFTIDPELMLFDDVLVIGDLETSINDLPGLTTEGESLSDNQDFITALNSLPTDDYNGVGYLSRGFIMGALDEGIRNVRRVLPVDMDMLQNTVEQIVFAHTVQDRSFIVDIVHTGGAMMMPYAPLDLSLLDLLSAQTSLVVQGNSLGNQVQAMFDALYEMDSALKEQGASPNDLPGFLADLGTDDLATFLRLSIEGTYQIDLSETLAWMNGDYVLFAGVRPDESRPLGVAPEGGFFMRTDNPEATAQFVEKSMEVIMDIFAPATFEDGTGHIPLGAIFSMPELGNVTYTSNDDMLMLGMSDSVNFALEPGAVTLRDTPIFEYESQYFLEDPVDLIYLNLAPLRETVAALMENGTIPVSPSDSAIVDALLNIVDSASLTMQMNGDDTQMRFTLTFGK